MFDSGPKLSWLGISAVITGILIFLLIDNAIEPWVVETLCRELVRCDG